MRSPAADALDADDDAAAPIASRSPAAVDALDAVTSNAANLTTTESVATLDVAVTAKAPDT
jgi:hypothetical protein